VMVKPTDPLAVTAAEDYVLRAFLAILDALPITAGDTGFAATLLASVDALAVALSDAGSQTQSAPNAFIAASDALAVALTDASKSITALVRTSDTFALALADLAAILYRVRPVDTFSVVLSSPLVVLTPVTASDTAQVALADSAVAFATGAPVIKSVVDALAVVADDSRGTALSDIEGDNGAIGISERATVYTLIASTDSFRVVPNDTNATSIVILNQAILASETLALVAVDNAAQLRAAFSAVDAVAPQLADTLLAMFVRLSTNDPAGLVLGDTGAVVALFDTFFQSITASDTAAVQVSEVATAIKVVLTILASDSAALALIDAGSVNTASGLVSLSTTDTLAVTTEDVTAAIGIVLNLVASDSAAVALSDSSSVFNGNTFVSVTTSEALGVGAQEVATAIAVVLQGIFGADALTLALAETGSTQVVRLLLNGFDVAPLALDEFDFPPTVFTSLPAGDVLSLLAADVGARTVLEGLLDVLAGETLTIGLDDATIVSLLGTLLDVRADDTLATILDQERYAAIMAGAAGSDDVKTVIVDLGASSVVLNLLPGGLLVATATMVSPRRTAELARG